MRLGFLHVEAGSPQMYRELATRMVRSAKEVMPGVEIVQMTDTRTPAIKGVDDVYSMKPVQEFAPYRLLHLAHFPADKPAIFLDTDVIVKRDMREAFNESFDVGLTKRDYAIFGRQSGRNLTEIMPFNTGVMFCRDPNFFMDCYEVSLTCSPEEQRWFADQIAIARVAATGDWDVKEFQCEVWNRVPVRADDLGQAYAVHYKGEKRKAWMLA